ncbi:MAG: chemotaxis-related protein WspD [Halothiobacillaceae bacterium]|nr:MAG: chemotaxis-related protein WspD [Halothiobacillaceae bacterium]
MLNEEMVIEECWNTIGSWGNQQQRCDRLLAVQHCSHCEVYSQAGRRLLNRQAPAGYLEEWRELIAGVSVVRDTDVVSMVLFRIDDTHYALSTKQLERVTTMGRLHHIPHVKERAILGVANVAGELVVALALRTLLTKQGAPLRVDELVRRAVVVLINGVRWMIPVHEIYGIDRISLKNSLRYREQGSALSAEEYFLWQDKTVIYIDHHALEPLLRELRF